LHIACNEREDQQGIYKPSEMSGDESSDKKSTHKKGKNKKLHASEPQDDNVDAGLDDYTSRDTLVTGDSLLDALDELGLVMGPAGFAKKLGVGLAAASVVGGVYLLARMVLVPDGCVGLSTHNGRPVFLRPGRYTIISPTHSYIEHVSVNQPLIKHGPITIVTINRGELGLSWKNGHQLLLEQGRHILIAPHVYKKSKKISEQFIKLGPLKRILVQQGEVGIGYDTGKLEVLQPGLHIRNSPTYRFRSFVSVQAQVKRLETLKVNTNDGIAINVGAILTYRIDDPAVAFRDVKDVSQALQDRAEATLTSIFLHHSIDDIAPTLPSTQSNRVAAVPGGMEEDDVADDQEKKGRKKGKAKEKGVTIADTPEETISSRFSDIVREAFLSQLKDSVEDWGVTLLDMSIEQLEFNDAALMKLLAERASNKLKTAADRATISAKAATGIQKAEGLAQEQRIKADADLYTAEQRAKGARLQENSALARELEMLRAMKEVVAAAGDKTTFIPWNMFLDMRNGGDFWLRDGASSDKASSAKYRS
jgi:regulator of protease activity HflC (stomatin/prohibitin superfamily)